jgi:cyanobactin biosynthesis protein (PatB/AcyB/McaB family)
MKLPKQVKPVVRPALIQPDTVLNLRNATGEDEGLNLVFALQNGANYNDPMRFSTPFEFCGCHLLSVTSPAICQALFLR